jgi:phosphoglycolate phosphatase
MNVIVSATLPPPSAILFDWDNTLVENWRNIHAALNAALADAGKEQLDIEQVKILARHAAGSVLPQLFGPGVERAKGIFYAHFAANHLAGLRIMEGAEILMDQLLGRNVPLGIVSNKKGDLLRREVGHLGWSERFQTVVGAQDAKADKPDPAPIYLALERMHISTGSDIWMVGDTDVDMAAGQAAGCTTILIGPGPADPALMEGLTPALRCHNCTAFSGFLRDRWNTI